MQLSLTYKRCSCEKCVSAKDCLTLNAKSINDKVSQPSGQPVRPRTFSRARPTRPRARHSYGSQQLHRLDHTYAAAEVRIEASTMSNGLQLQRPLPHRQPQLLPHSIERLLKPSPGTPSPKLVDLQSRQRSRLKVKADETDKENQLPTPNGKLKQYQKCRVVNNKIQGSQATAKAISIQSSKALKIVNEERKRWIAASALLDLSRRIVKFSDYDK